MRSYSRISVGVNKDMKSGTWVVLIKLGLRARGCLRTRLRDLTVMVSLVAGRCGDLVICGLGVELELRDVGTCLPRVRDPQRQARAHSCLAVEAVGSWSQDEVNM